MKIAILCPSRERPQRFNAMRESAMQTAANPGNIEIRLALDIDDPTKEEYPQRAVILSLFRPVACLFNRLAKLSPADIYLIAADDVLFRTQGWDTQICETFKNYPDGLLVVAPNNGDGNKRVNHWCVGRQWLELFGWVVCEHFDHFYSDQWTQEVAAAADRLIYLDGFLLEHMHAKLGKSDNDGTYRAKREREKAKDGLRMSERDAIKFSRLKRELEEDKELLRNAVAKRVIHYEA